MDADHYQLEAHKTSKVPEPDILVYGLMGEAGEVASAIKQARIASNEFGETDPVLVTRISEEIGDLIWYATELATVFDLSLSDILERNLSKAVRLYSAQFKELDVSQTKREQFPKEGTFHFYTTDGKLHLTLNGKPVGDPLDDNAHHADGYRYHDIFHIVFMVLLDWSPVMRQLLDKKRRSGQDTDTDRVEDGARARFTEEGLTALLFSQSDFNDATSRSMFSEPRYIPFDVIVYVKKMTENLEINGASVTMWRDAISQAFQLFDSLIAHNGGEILFDRSNRENRTIRFRASA